MKRRHGLIDFKPHPRTSSFCYFCTQCNKQCLYFSPFHCGRNGVSKNSIKRFSVSCMQRVHDIISHPCYTAAGT